MSKLEKVIKGLEACSLAGTEDDCVGYGCPYLIYNDEVSDDCQEQLFDDALALLKAQEPRVIQFDEIDNYEVLWLEIRDFDSEEGLAPWVKTRSGNWFSPLFCGELRPDMILSTPEEYGKFCRCWTFRPDEKRRKETPWN